MDINNLDNGSLRAVVVRLAAFNLFWSASSTIVFLLFQSTFWTPLFMLPPLIVPYLGLQVLRNHHARGTRLYSLWLQFTVVLSLLASVIVLPIMIVMARRDGFEEMCRDAGDYCTMTAFTSMAQMMVLGAGFQLYYTLAVRRFATIMRENPDAFPAVTGRGIYLPVSREESA
ncbi:hypothetical protein BDZ88DRAFT_407444 [Geranomyces variabilis]|nr:hypothetical protein BDZ88DRAFT_407444 [Geranomyces variabilis]KAJ3142448.1 hypothetical protein HDU90_004722 [Geranomyces variabilis]